MADVEIQKSEYLIPIDHCRFCYMCRQVCTVAVTTRDETLSPRSRALLLSSVLRNMLDFSPDLAEVVYKCCLCGYCESWCQGGWKPPEYVKAARRDMVKRKQVSEAVQELKGELLDEGNVFGIKRDQVDQKLQSAIESRLEKTETLLLLGNTVRYKTPEIGLIAMDLIKKCGPKISLLTNEDTSGFDLYDLGYEAEAKRVCDKLITEIKSVGCSMLLALDPRDAYYLSTEITKMGIELSDVDIVPLSKYIAGILKSVSFDATKKEAIVTYHDNGYLARYCDVIEEPREIIKSFPGIEYREMLWYGTEAHSPGSFLYSRLFPDICSMMVERRIQDVIETGAQMLLTASPEDWSLFENHPALPEDMEVMDLFAFINTHL